MEEAMEEDLVGNTFTVQSLGLLIIFRELT
jgi:hypothetical protein